MRPQERQDSPINALRMAMRGWQAGIWTALPGIVVSYNAAKRTAVIQPTVQAKVLQKTGESKNETLPVCPDVPVLFPGGGGFSLTFPLAAGNEGLLIFCSRSIDATWQSGGVQPQVEQRLHDLSDGMFIPAAYSQQNLPVSPNTTGPCLRNTDGTALVEMGGGGIVRIVAPGGLTLVGTLTVEGGDVIADGISLKTHKHTGGTIGGETGVPIP